MGVEILVVNKVSSEIHEAIAILVAQLSRTASPPSIEKLTEIAAHSANTLLIAKDTESDHIVGTLTLVRFPTLTGSRAHIEDVVVKQEYRGQGVGTSLLSEAIRLAIESNVTTIDLTSRPDRVEANRLYQKLGFIKRDTNLYRYTPNI